MHSNVSDGSCTPEEILDNVKSAGLDLFSLTDHDALHGCAKVKEYRQEGDPLFISGVEFSCKDEGGKYHILGYGYDAAAEPISSLVEKGHMTRFTKLKLRLDALKEKYGFEFSKEDIGSLYSLSNPGKPHIANMMVKYGYAETRNQAFSDYLNRLDIKDMHFRPEEAIIAIAESGGIPVLAHPSYGSGDELYVGEEMENRIKRLMNFGLQGLEGFYSGFTPALQKEILEYADKYNLYVTAGSDYHGTNKIIALGDNNLNDAQQAPKGLKRFLEEVPLR